MDFLEYLVENQQVAENRKNSSLIIVLPAAPIDVNHQPRVSGHVIVEYELQDYQWSPIKDGKTLRCWYGQENEYEDFTRDVDFDSLQGDTTYRKAFTGPKTEKALKDKVLDEGLREECLYSFRR